MADPAVHAYPTDDLSRRWHKVLVVGVSQPRWEELLTSFCKLMPVVPCLRCDYLGDLGDPGTLLVLPYRSGSSDNRRLKAARAQGKTTPVLFLASSAAQDSARLELQTLVPAAFLLPESCGADSVGQALSQLALTEDLFADLQRAQQQLKQFGNRQLGSRPGPVPLRPLSRWNGRGDLASQPYDPPLLARIEREIQVARRRRSPLCCQIFSLLDFSALRARGGTAVTDCLTRQITGLLKRRLVMDVVGCCGEGEFVVVSRRLDFEGAFRQAQQLASILSRTYAPATTFPQVRVGTAFLREGMDGAQNLLSGARQALTAPGPVGERSGALVVFPQGPPLSYS